MFQGAFMFIVIQFAGGIYSLQTQGKTLLYVDVFRLHSQCELILLPSALFTFCKLVLVNFMLLAKIIEMTEENQKDQPSLECIYYKT